MNRRPLLLSAMIFVAGCTSRSCERQPDTEPVSLQQLPASRPSDMVRPTSQPSAIKFSAHSIEAIKAGKKTATVRKGARTNPVGPVTLSGSGVVIEFTSAQQTKLSDLTPVDAADDGSDSVDALKAQLAKDYPGIQPGDDVTVFRFRVVH